MLQNLLITHIPHLCGVNPKSFRTIRTVKKYHTNPARCVVDGDLVWHYLYLPATEKLELAKKIGAKIEDIYRELLDLTNTTSMF